jgi:hypothetical protein
MPKRKYTHHDIDLSVTHFLVKTPERNHQEAIELIIAQYVDLLAKTNRKVQAEHMVGLNEFLKEVENGVY